MREREREREREVKARDNEIIISALVVSVIGDQLLTMSHNVYLPNCVPIYTNMRN